LNFPANYTIIIMARAKVLKKKKTFNLLLKN